MLAIESNGPAIIELNESNLLHPTEYYLHEVRELVRVYASALRSSGLVRGQVVTCKEDTALEIRLVRLTFDW